MTKYTYNPDKLYYARVHNNLRFRFLRIFIFIMAGIFLAILLNIIYAVFFDTPYERQLRQENSALSQDFEFLYQRYNQIDTVLKSLKGTDENIYRMIFESEPVRRSGIKGSFHGILHFDLMERDNKNLVKETTYKLTELLDDVYLRSYEYENLKNLTSRKLEMLPFIPAIQPIANSELIRMASGYGYRMHPIYKIFKFHSGVDFTAPAGTPVFATGNGIVEEIYNTRRGSGNTIVIDHGFKYKTSYSHLDGFNVKKGKSVKRGEVIGWVGNTGLSVAPHLHYEVLLNNNAVNPVNYFFLELSPVQYDKIIELSIKSGQSFD